MFEINRKSMQIFAKCPFKKNIYIFIHYYRVSVSKGLNTELSTSDLILEKFDKEASQRRGFCHFTIEIKEAFTKEKDICNCCMSLLENEEQNNPKIHIIWTEN